MQEERLYPRRWAVLAGVFLLCFSIQFAIMVNGGMAVLIMGSFDYDAGQFAVLMTIPYLTGALLSFACGVASDKVGYNKVLVVGYVIAIVGCAWRAMAGSDFTQLILASLVMGVPAAALGAVAAKILRQWFPGTSNSLAMGVYVASASLGVAFGMLYGTRATDVTSAWTTCTVLVGVALVMWLVLYRKHPDGEGISEKSMSVHLKAVLKNKWVWGISIFTFIVMGATNVNGTYMIAGLTALAGTPEVVGEAGILSTLVTVVQCVASIVLPVVFVAKFKRMRTPIAIACLGAAVVYAIIYFFPYGPQTWVLYLISPLFIGLLAPITGMLPVLLPGVKPEQIGTIGGVQMTFQNIGMWLVASFVLAPIATAIDPTGGVGFYQAIYVGAACVLVCGVLAMFLFPNVHSNVGAKIAEEMATGAGSQTPAGADGAAGRASAKTGSVATSAIVAGAVR